MNTREWEWMTPDERNWRDGSTLPVSYLLKCLALKARRRLWGWFRDRDQRFVWTAYATTECDGPSLVARTHQEHAAIRALLKDLSLVRVCELGCGYGRMAMLLRELAPRVTGFEREPHLLSQARALLPGVHFVAVEDLAAAPLTEPHDLAMTFTVLQHLTDEDARKVCKRMMALAPRGHLLIVEMTDPVNDHPAASGHHFLTRARSVDTYSEYVTPFRLVATAPRPVDEGVCMLFQAPAD